MWFDAQAALKQLDGAETHRPTPASPEKPRATSLAGLAGLAAGHAPNPQNLPSIENIETLFPYGASVGGRSRTYTGRVVSLDAWRKLSDWEAHGPRGRHWCGVTQKWIDTKGD